MTIAELLQSATAANQLSDSPGLDCELLLCFVLGVDPSYLKTWPERQVSDAQQLEFEALLQRRVVGEPMCLFNRFSGILEPRPRGLSCDTDPAS